MDSPRWKPLTGTPSKPPLPPNILVPDPSPARSTYSDAESLTMLPPSPQGSFIHRRRQGQYIPRPPVWNVSKPNQEPEVSDSGHLEAKLHGSPAPAGWCDLQLPGMSVDDQVRKMADVFYERPLVVNMMTGQEPQGGSSCPPGKQEEGESEIVHSRPEQLHDERELKVPDEQHFNNVNASMGTTAVGSKHSSTLPEGNITAGAAEEDRRLDLTQIQRLLNDVQNALQRQDRLLSNFQNLSSSRDHNAPFQSEELADVQSTLQRNHQLLADLQSEHRALTRAAGPVTSLPSSANQPTSSTNQSTDGGVPVASEQQAIAHTPRQAPVIEPFPEYRDSGTVRSGTQTTPSRGTREDMNFAQRAAYDASHLAVAQRLPRALRNTDEINDAGLDGIPSAPEDLQASTNPPQEGQATKKSKRKTIFGFFQRSTGLAVSSSTSAKQTGPNRNHNEESGNACGSELREDAAEAAGASATELARQVMGKGKITALDDHESFWQARSNDMEDPAHEKKTIQSRFKEWRNTFGRSSMGHQSASSNPQIRKKPSVKLKGILKNRDYVRVDSEELSDDGRLGENAQGEEQIFRRPVRLSDPDNPLLGGITEAENDNGTMRGSNERSSMEERGTASPNPFRTPFDDQQHRASTDVTSRYSWVSPERQSLIAVEDDAASSSVACADHAKDTTPTLAESILAANAVDDEDDIVNSTTRQGPLADITNQPNAREHDTAGPSNSRPAPATRERSVTYVTDTPRMRPLDDVPVDEELILPPTKSQSTTPMLRPNELREEIKALNPLHPALDSY